MYFSIHILLKVTMQYQYVKNICSSSECNCVYVLILLSPLCVNNYWIILSYYGTEKYFEVKQKPMYHLIFLLSWVTSSGPCPLIVTVNQCCIISPRLRNIFLVLKYGLYSSQNHIIYASGKSCVVVEGPFIFCLQLRQ